MFQSVNKRIEFHKKSFRLLWVIVAAVWTLFSNAATVRDNFLPPVWQQRLATLNLLPKWPWYVWVIGMLMIALVALLEGTFRAHGARTQDNKHKPELHKGHLHTPLPASTEAEPTLVSLMDTSFPNLNKLWGKPMLTFEDGATLQLTSALYFDLFTSGAKFLGFHVPSSPRTLEACSAIAAHATELGDALGDGGLKVICRAPGENPQTISDLRYSGKVYLYHDDALTHKQMADVEGMFKTQQLSVVLRGPDFLNPAWVAWMDKKAKDKDKATAITWISHFADMANGLALNAPNEDASRMEIVKWKRQVDEWRNETASALSSLSVVALNKFSDSDMGAEIPDYIGKDTRIWSDLALLDERRRNLKEIMEKTDVYLAKVV
jgi:hypothetical protein